MLKSNDLELVRRSVNILICLCQKRIWNGQRTVNQLASVLLCPDMKCAASACHFFLGNKVKVAKEIAEDSDATDEEVEKAKELQKQAGLKMGQKKTRGNMKRLKKGQKNAAKLLKKRDGISSAFDSISNFHAIDNIHDPHTLVDKMLKRVGKTGDPFSFRLVMLSLLCRIIARHHMIVVNIFPLLQRWLNPHQRQVTQVLACLAQACHELVPPEELAVVVKHIMEMFVTDSLAPAVCSIGINSIREICVRQPLALNEEQLAEIVLFKKNKDKGVAAASRAMMNLYRDVNPAMLHQSLRGREANIAVRSGQVQAPVFGKSQFITDGVEGAELLVRAKRAKGLKHGQDIGDEDIEDVAVLGEHGYNTSDEEGEFEEGERIDLPCSDDEEEGDEGEEEEGEEGSDGEEQEELTEEQQQELLAAMEALEGDEGGLSSDDEAPQLVDKDGKPVPVEDVEHATEESDDDDDEDEEKGSDAELFAPELEDGELVQLVEGGSANSEDGGKKISMQDVRKANQEVRKARVHLKQMQVEEKFPQEKFRVFSEMRFLWQF